MQCQLILHHIISVSKCYSCFPFIGVYELNTQKALDSCPVAEGNHTASTVVCLNARVSDDLWITHPTRHHARRIPFEYQHKHTTAVPSSKWDRIERTLGKHHPFFTNTTTGHARYDHRFAVQPLQSAQETISRSNVSYNWRSFKGQDIRRSIEWNEKSRTEIRTRSEHRRSGGRSSCVRRWRWQTLWSSPFALQTADTRRDRSAHGAVEHRDHKDIRIERHEQLAEPARHLFWRLLFGARGDNHYHGSIGHDSSSTVNAGKLPHWCQCQRIGHQKTRA